jgi:hypothetical protein
VKSGESVTILATPAVRLRQVLNQFIEPVRGMQQEADRGVTMILPTIVPPSSSGVIEGVDKEG